MSKSSLCKNAWLLGFILQFLIFSVAAFADSNLLDFKSSAFNAELSGTTEGEREILTLRISDSTHKKSSVFTVPDPERIVIDLMGTAIKKNKDYNITSSSLIKSVRFGSHKDKTRIVLDLKTTDTAYSTSDSQGELTLKIEKAPKEKNRASEVKQEKPKIEEETQIIKPLKKVEPTVKVEPTLKAEDGLKESTKAEEQDVLIEELIEKKPAPTPTKTPVKLTATAPPVTTAVSTPTAGPSLLPTEIPAGTAAATALPQTQALRSIKFSYTQGLKPSPVIKLDLVNKAQFELQKTDEKTYTLTIKDCREFKPELKLVSFPPHDFAGFTYVKADANKTDVDIKIGVERNKRITATPNENEIWVSLLEEDKSDARTLPVKKDAALQRSLNRPSR